MIYATLGAVTTLLLALIFVPIANAQNMTTNNSNSGTSNIIKNATAKLNLTTTNGTAKTTALLNITASKFAGNASEVPNKTAGNATVKANQTVSELGKNASKAGGQILNKTEDLGKKIVGGLGSLLGNASQKLKESSK